MALQTTKERQLSPCGCGRANMRASAATNLAESETMATSQQRAAKTRVAREESKVAARSATTRPPLNVPEELFQIVLRICKRKMEPLWNFMMSGFLPHNE